MPQAPDHRQRFLRLDQLLTTNQALWRPVPFIERRPVWLDEQPQLAQWLLALSDEQVQRLQGDDDVLLAALAPRLPAAAELAALIDIARRGRPLAGDERLQRDVPGRKWQQLQAFGGALGELSLPALEWCAGKAHLGRLLSASGGATVTALEIDPALVADGERLAARLQLPVTLQACDVLGDTAASHLQPRLHALALHACGGLHLRLLQLAAERGVQRISLSPCCYHLHPPPGQESHYRPLSATAAASALRLRREELRLAVRQSATAPARVRRNRARLQAWRLGFDLLQRELRGRDDYLPVPPLSETVLTDGFEAFCRRVAELKQLALPARVDFDAFEQRGQQRFDEVERLTLLPMAFRRALELWLVLDRALYLEENGYHCELTQFCERELTPRNLLLDARLVK